MRRGLVLIPAVLVAGCSVLFDGADEGEAQVFFPGDRPVAATATYVGDADGDGTIDLALASEAGGGNSGVYIFPGPQDAGALRGSFVELGIAAKAITFADLRDSAVPALIAAGPEPGGDPFLEARIQEPAGTFSPALRYGLFPNKFPVNLAATSNVGAGGLNGVFVTAGDSIIEVGPATWDQPGLSDLNPIEWQDLVVPGPVVELRFVQRNIGNDDEFLLLTRSSAEWYAPVGAMQTKSAAATGCSAGNALQASLTGADSLTEEVAGFLLFDQALCVVRADSSSGAIATYELAFFPGPPMPENVRRSPVAFISGQLGGGDGMDALVIASDGQYWLGLDTTFDVFAFEVLTEASGSIATTEVAAHAVLDLDGDGGPEIVLFQPDGRYSCYRAEPGGLTPC